MIATHFGFPNSGLPLQPSSQVIFELFQISPTHMPGEELNIRLSVNDFYVSMDYCEGAESCKITTFMKGL